MGHLQVTKHCIRTWASVLLLLTWTSHLCTGLNILALTPPVGRASQSHFHLLTRLSDTLVSRGHHVTMPLHLHMRSVSELVEEFRYGSALTADQWEANTQSYMRELVYGNITIDQITSMLHTTANECDVMLADDTLYATLTSRRFDVAIVDHIFSCGFLYAGRLGLPVIVLECGGQQSSLTDTPDPYPLAYAPVDNSGLTHRMTFGDRLKNAISYWLNVLLSPRVMFTPFTDLQARYLVSPPGGIGQLKKEALLWVSNQCWALNYPRPLLPDVITAGGILTRPAQPLPQNLQTVYEEAGEAGVVVVSFGSYLSLSSLPGLEGELLSGLAHLPQRVIYRADHKPTNPPSNVITRSHIPQNDLLGHPQTKVAVLHGGLNGVYEAMYHAVPVLLIPTAFDATDNAVRLRDKGMALIIRPCDVTKQRVRDALTELLTNASYKQRAEVVSAIFRDQPQLPVDKAAFWVEHVMRHVTERYLRPSGGDLYWWQLYMCDVTAFVILVLVVVTALVYKLVKCVVFKLKLWLKWKRD